MRVPRSSPSSPAERSRGAARGPVVIDTGVFGAELVSGSRLAARYEPLIAG
jgi:hypothetical protein